MISIKVTVMVVTLVTLCILSTDTRLERQWPMMCCYNYLHHRIPFKGIEGFSVLNSTQCRISGIVFHTKRGRQICANPADEWVMNYVRRLESKAEQVHEKSVEMG
uniref:C-C motif chemokine n=1 Tax=Fundulus heteroclitus TaxID=8078 RepID=Q5XVR3_FUNHE|nr:small inducible cytokine A4 [Fundulus heteroclitus]